MPKNPDVKTLPLSPETVDKIVAEFFIDPARKMASKEAIEEGMKGANGFAAQIFNPYGGKLNTPEEISAFFTKNIELYYELFNEKLGTITASKQPITYNDIEAAAKSAHEEVFAKLTDKNEIKLATEKAPYKAPEGPENRVLLATIDDKAFVDAYNAKYKEFNPPPVTITPALQAEAAKAVASTGAAVVSAPQNKSATPSKPEKTQLELQREQAAKDEEARKAKEAADAEAKKGQQEGGFMGVIMKFLEPILEKFKSFMPFLEKFMGKKEEEEDKTPPVVATKTPDSPAIQAQPDVRPNEQLPPKITNPAVSAGR